jgi:MFS family permease
VISRIHGHAPRRLTVGASLDDWRRFAAPRFRPYHLLAVGQGSVMVLAGFEVIIPFALEVGAPPAVAVLLGALPVAGGMAQLFIPRLLDRTEGNLRGITLLVAAGGETRGLLLAGLALSVAAGLVSGALAVVALAVIVALAGVLGAVSNANLLAWHSAVLDEQERRLVVPRLMAVSMAVGALMLLPFGLLLDGLADRVGLVAYALPFLIAGLFGVVEVVAVHRLPRPGRVIVPKPRSVGAAPESPQLQALLRASAANALGMGVTPYLSVYAIVVLGLSAGFAMSLGALSMLTMVVAAAIAGGRLARGSSARMLRASFGVRAAAIAMPILALPGSLLAPLILCATAMLAAVGFVMGQLAANERLYRLISGPSVIRHHGRYLARTSGAMAAGQLASSAVLAAGGPLGYPVFAALYAVSSGLRVVAFRLASPSDAVRPAVTGPATARPAEPLIATRPLTGAG